LSFIFLTAFAFLNMVIGIVVNVLEDEHVKEKMAEDKANGKISIDDLAAEIRSLKAMLVQHRKDLGDISQH
jgi:voltage-gated sodium channel